MHVTEKKYKPTKCTQGTRKRSACLLTLENKSSNVKNEKAKGKRLTKFNKALEDNRRLKERLYNLESSVSAYSSTVTNKEDRLQVELQVQKDLSKALEKKTEEYRIALEESEHCKSTAFDRIIELETQCQKLKKKIITQEHEIANMKFKYNELKKCGK
ncbi:uncharacterized protein LOC106669662 [Cimex lectularius]|uniref:Uncharacterized protein n=1 Tax=Cimex lectularius TaxID=79782 RepID=A0A8I6S0H4_CIMLE|nr:uncharacterized protein LOC106669662 [Cimex lectularius]